MGFDFDGFGNRADKFTESAKCAPRGLAKEQLVPGAYVTISPSLATGDRSYSTDVFEVVASNGGHVMVRHQDPSRASSWFKGPHLLPIQEHHFYAAEHMIVPKPAEEAAEIQS